MKRRTTSLGAANKRDEMEKRWLKAWEDLPQETIQAWVERIPYHIAAIISEEGGNGYAEGIPGFKRSWKGDRLKGQLLPQATMMDAPLPAPRATPSSMNDPHTGIPQIEPPHQYQEDD
jgi:hypothetical protein